MDGSFAQPSHQIRGLKSARFRRIGAEVEGVCPGAPPPPQNHTEDPNTCLQIQMKRVWGLSTLSFSARSETRSGGAVHGAVGARPRRLHHAHQEPHPGRPAAAAAPALQMCTAAHSLLQLPTTMSAFKEYAILHFGSPIILKIIPALQ